jgi:hypothetical protein
MPRPSPLRRRGFEPERLQRRVDPDYVMNVTALRGDDVAGAHGAQLALFFDDGLTRVDEPIFVAILVVAKEPRTGLDAKDPRGGDVRPHRSVGRRDDPAGIFLVMD